CLARGNRGSARGCRFWPLTSGLWLLGDNVALNVTIFANINPSVKTPIYGVDIVNLYLTVIRVARFSIISETWIAAHLSGFDGLAALFRITNHSATVDRASLVAAENLCRFEFYPQFSGLFDSDRTQLRDALVGDGFAIDE